ncbi:MAG: hypothetical protein M8353_07310 [ANME-2 cluster archaeon]|nr:hypothetical protein [ANME-2 cluster archaeon]
MSTKTILLILIIALMAVFIGVSAANSSESITILSQTPTGVSDNLAACPNFVDGVCNPATGNTYDCSQSSGACCNNNKN